MPALCKYCGQVVWGSYISALGETWHPEHFFCAGCGQPLRSERFAISQGQPYHPACYLELVAPRCAYCHKPLVGLYIVNGWGEKFCQEHQTQYPACSFCARLIPPQQQMSGWRFDENLRCQVCRLTAVETAEQAQPLFTELKRWIARQGFQFNQLPLRLDLRERAELERLLQGRTVAHPLGVTLSSMHWQNGRKVGSRIEGIAVQIGMPATLFAGTVLHEIGHVWLTVHGVENLPSWAEEGFCQLLSYRYYSDLGTPEARYRMTSIEQDADPVYGEGFRRLNALSARVGFARLVEILRTTKRLPNSSHNS